MFDVEAIFFPLSKILKAKMHARMLWRRLRIVLSISLNFSFSQNEKAVSFDQNENNATFTENLKLFQWFKMFHSFIDLGLKWIIGLVFFVSPIVTRARAAAAATTVTDCGLGFKLITNIRPRRHHHVIRDGG